MKIVLILSIGILLRAGTVFGQAGAIGLFPDSPSYYWCSFEDVLGLVPVYAVHKNTPGATASQWKVVASPGFTCINTGEIVHMPTSIGSAFNGISLGYGGCFASDILLVTINFFCQGTSEECSYLYVVGDPGSGSGQVEVVDCDFTLLIGAGGGVYVNPDGSGTCDCLITVTETTWGKIKASY